MRPEVKEDRAIPNKVKYLEHESNFVLVESCAPLCDQTDGPALESVGMLEDLVFSLPARLLCFDPCDPGGHQRCSKRLLRALDALHIYLTRYRCGTRYLTRY